MDLTKHCQLCDHKIFDFHTGSSCGLTEEKPHFNRKCGEILFGQNLEARIKEVNIEYEQVKRSKALSIANFVVFLLLGVGVMAGGYLLGAYAFERTSNSGALIGKGGVVFTVPLIIMGIGLSFFPLSFGPLNNYRYGMAVAGKKKKELDDLLRMYNLEYSIEVNITKDLHGNKEIETDLKFLRKHYR